MPKLINFRNKKQSLLSSEKNFNALLKDAVEIGQKSLGEIKAGKF
jgi:hypothetical protein